MIQGGDITDGDGKGGDSIYDGSFADENLHLAHDEPYLLSMANRGPDTNKSQFFITTNEAPHLDRKHVVFGRVVSGLDTILKIERQEVDSKSRPLKKVVVKDCGQLSSSDIQIRPTTEAEKEKRKRKLSNSSRSSDDSRVIRRRRRTPTSPQSSASKYSSCSSNRSGYPRRSRTRQPRHRRSPSCCSSASGSSSGDSSNSSISSNSISGASSSRSSRSSSTGSSSSRSSSSCDSLNSRSKRRKKLNRRLEPTREVQDFKKTVKKENEDDADKDEFVNPHYKCSIKPDEIPEVPVNRFLLRGMPEKVSSKKEDEDEVEPIQVDLSKFEDIPDDEVEVSKPSDKQLSSTISSDTSLIRTNLKPPEPLVSKSGRIMKGRGTFKFRTPSPEDKSRSYSSNRRTESPGRSGSYRNRDSHKSGLRRSRSRSRDRNRSPMRYSRHEEDERRRRSYRSSNRRDR